MKKLMAIVLTIALVLAVSVISVPTSAAVSTVITQGLESGLPQYTDAVYSLNTNAQYSHSGNNSARINSTNLAWSVYELPLGTVSPSTQYELTFWYHVKTLSGANICVVPVTSANGNVWSSGPKYPVGFPNNNSNFSAISNLSNYFIIPVACGRNAWYKGTVVFTTDSTSAANTIWFNLYAQSATTVDIYFDDITVKKVGTATTYTYVDTYETDGNAKAYGVADVGATIDYTPVRKGYKFLGFYTDKTYSTKVTTYNSTNTTLYAKWEKGEGVYDVNFNANGGIYNGVESAVMFKGDSLNDFVPVHPIFDFEGWFTAAEGGEMVTSVQADGTLYAHWTDKQGFESFYKSKPNHMGSGVYISGDEAKSGVKSLCFDSSKNAKNDYTGAFSRVGFIEDNKYYSVTFSYKAVSLNNTAVKVSLFNYPVYSLSYPNVAFCDKTLTISSESSTWKTATLNFNSNVDIYDGMTADTLGLYFTLTKDTGSAKVYVDDVVITETDGYQSGDANGDGDISSLDIVRIKKYIAGNEVCAYLGADANNDSNISSLDIVRIKRYIVGKTAIPAKTVPAESSLKGVKWAVIGDSITDKTNTTAAIRYYDRIASETGCIASQYGISGTGYVSGNGGTYQFFNRSQRISGTPDLITILGSVNDYGFDIGTVNDTSTSTLCGCFNKTIADLKAKYPNAVIAIISPFPCGGGTMIPTNETKTNKSHLYTEMLQQLAAKYDLPFLDVYHSSSLEPYDGDFCKAYFHNGDGCHPNLYGHQMVYKQIKIFLEQVYAEAK